MANKATTTADVAPEAFASDYGAGESVEPTPAVGPAARFVPELGRVVDPEDPDALHAAALELERIGKKADAKFRRFKNQADASVAACWNEEDGEKRRALGATLKKAWRECDRASHDREAARRRQRELEAAGGEPTAWAFEDTEHRFWSDVDAKTDARTLTTWPDGAPAGPRPAPTARAGSNLELGFATSDACIADLDRVAAENRLSRSAVAGALARHAIGGDDPGFRIRRGPDTGNRTVSMRLSPEDFDAVWARFAAGRSLSEPLRRAVFAKVNQRTPQIGPEAETARGPSGYGPTTATTATMSTACRAAVEGVRPTGWSLSSTARALIRHALYGEDAGIGPLDVGGARGGETLAVCLDAEERAAVHAFTPEARTVSDAVRAAIFADANVVPDGDLRADAVPEPEPEAVAGSDDHPEHPERIAGRLEGVSERVEAEGDAGGLLREASVPKLAAELLRRLIGNGRAA